MRTRASGGLSGWVVPGDDLNLRTGRRAPPPKTAQPISVPRGCSMPGMQPCGEQTEEGPLLARPVADAWMPASLSPPGTSAPLLKAHPAGAGVHLSALHRAPTSAMAVPRAWGPRLIHLRLPIILLLVWLSCNSTQDGEVGERILEHIAPPPPRGNGHDSSTSMWASQPRARWGVGMCTIHHSLVPGCSCHPAGKPLPHEEHTVTPTFPSPWQHSLPVLICVCLLRARRLRCRLCRSKPVW